MKNSSLKSILGSLWLSTLCAISGAPSQASGVPSAYASSYAALDQAVDTFVTSLDSRSNAGNPSLGAVLDTANGAKGLNLLQPSTLTNVQTEINRYRLLGMKAVTVNINFPLGCQQFWSQKMNNASSAQQMMAFYQQVVQKCHAAGMHVHVDAHPPYPYSGDTFGPTCQSFSSRLSPAQYQSCFAEHISNIASIVQPDGIGIVSQPDTDLNWTAQTVYQYPGSLAAFVQVMVNQIAAANTKNGTHVYSTAGAPNWLPIAQNFNNAFFKVSGLTAIDLNINFSGNNELEFATQLADAVHAAGKPLVVSGSWLTKYGVGTPPVHGVGSAQIEIETAKTSFSFWEPLDCKFVAAMKKFARVETPAIFTFSYPEQLFAYTNYSSVSSDSDPAIIGVEKQAELQMMSQGEFSSTGTRLGELNR